MRVLIFSTAFVRNISRSKKNSARYYKLAWIFTQSSRYSCQIFTQSSRYSCQIFTQSSRYSCQIFSQSSRYSCQILMELDFSSQIFEKD
jgi:hypothetical protein